MPRQPPTTARSSRLSYPPRASSFADTTRNRSSQSRIRGRAIVVEIVVNSRAYRVRVVVSELWRFELPGIGHVHPLERVRGGIDDAEGALGERRRHRGGASRSDGGDERRDDVDETTARGLITTYARMVVRRCVILTGTRRARASTIRRLARRRPKRPELTSSTASPPRAPPWRTSRRRRSPSTSSSRSYRTPRSIAAGT